MWFFSDLRGDESRRPGDAVFPSSFDRRPSQLGRNGGAVDGGGKGGDDDDDDDDESTSKRGGHDAGREVSSKGVMTGVTI
jgi:hypothetical protein